MKPPRLLLLTDDSISTEHVAEVWPRVARACAPGSVALSVRYRTLEARALSLLCEHLQRSVPGAPVVVSRRLDIARSVGLAGVHLPASGVPSQEARLYLGEHALIIRAAHDAAELDQAVPGADAALLSPFLAPGSHASERPPLGKEGFQALASSSAVPVLALGGMDARTAPQALSAGAYGVAVVSAVWKAPDPVAACVALLQAGTPA